MIYAHDEDAIARLQQQLSSKNMIKLREYLGQATDALLDAGDWDPCDVAQMVLASDGGLVRKLAPVLVAKALVDMATEAFASRQKHFFG